MSNPTVEIKFELFDQITSGVKKIEEAMGGFKSGIGQLSNYIDDVGKKFFFMNQLSEGMQRFNQSVKDFAAPGADFQQQIADLSAITGLTGNNLDIIAESSRKIGKESGLGASAAAEAYKLLASNIDYTKIGIQGLQDLQKNTVTLSQASGIDMATAANVMSGAINQFGYAATEAKRVTNVLGAGAKYGAAEIADLGASLKVSGTTAAMAGITIEGATGAIEVMSQSMIKGEQAGTYLRNILLKLQTEGIPGVDLKTQGLAGALDTLKPKLNDMAWLTKTFGMENVNAAQLLIANSAAVDEMTQKVTRTNVAYDQAAIRTQTYQFAMSKIKAQMDDYKISVFNATGSMLPWIETITQSTSGIFVMLPGLKIMKDSFLFLGKAVKTHVVDLWNYIKGLRATQGAMQATTISAQVLSTAMRAIPAVFAIGAIIALTYKFKELTTATMSSSIAMKNLKESQAGIYQEFNKQAEEAKQLFKNATDLNSSYNDRVEALKKLQDLAPDYFENFNTETILTQKASGALDDYISKLEEKANKEAYFNQIVKKKQDLLNVQNTPAAELEVNQNRGVKGFLSNIFTGDTGGNEARKRALEEQINNEISLLQTGQQVALKSFEIYEKIKGYSGGAVMSMLTTGNKLYDNAPKNDAFVFGSNYQPNTDNSSDNKNKKTLDNPQDKINDVSGKASVKNVYITMEAGLKIGTVQNTGSQSIDEFIKELKTGLNLALNDANNMVA